MPEESPAGQWVKEQRPWGHFDLLLKNAGEAKVTAKIISVNPNSRLSLQKHEARSEYWFVMDGDAKVDAGSDTMVLHAGGTVSISRGTPHRLSTNAGTRVLEISVGSFDEADIVRLEDDYGRV